MELKFVYPISRLCTFLYSCDYFYYIILLYVINGVCLEQYTGKTIHFGARSKEHCSTSKFSVIHSHKQNCNICSSTSDFNITFVESYLQRGKFSLSEREFLWNGRIKGSMNVQKTLKA